MKQWMTMALAAACVPALLLAGTGANAPKASPGERLLKRFNDEFVLLTPGKGKYPARFIMGSEKGPAAEQPAHAVTFGYSFAVARYEVTQELYESIMGKNPSRWRGPRNSVEMVSWDEAVAFCGKISEALRRHKLLEKDEEIRLPSEAEWEYACRAGTTTAFSFGDALAELGQYAWFTGNAKGNDPPVGVKKPNSWGLYDMHGYVWEWCTDAWHPDYKDAPRDGSARADAKATERLVRGGAWTEVADHCRSAYRHHVPRETRTAAIGLRCIRARASNQERKTI
jgi:formylglycine-generating enzyme required for sulfatase activity